jgi:hypothetical protein
VLEDARPHLGSTVVFKPPRHAALRGPVELLKGRLPAGTVNLVTDGGEEVGMAIVESADVNVISFTGNTETGREIATRAGKRLKRLGELGGRTRSLSWPTPTSTSRRRHHLVGLRYYRPALPACTAGRPEVADALVQTGRSGVEAAAGVGADPNVVPLINRARSTRCRPSNGGREGARLVTGGEAPSGPADLNTATTSSRRFSTASSRWIAGPGEIFGPLLSSSGGHYTRPR